MSETMGRCRSEMNAAYERTRFRFKPNDSDEVIADAIDRLAADVAAIKAKTSDIEWEAVQHFVESEKAWVKLVEEQRDAAIRERDQWREEARLAVINRDEARAEVERLTARLGDRSEVQQTQLSAAFTEGTLQAGDAMRARFEQVEKERDEARAEVERLRAELAAPQPAAPATGWLTDEERHILSAHLQALREQRRAMERGGQTLGYSANPCGLKREADAIDALLARAGSPPGQTAALWLTDKERAVVEDIASMIQQWFKMAWSDTDEKRCAVLRSILARAGSPPVVVLPTVFARSLLGDELVALQQVKDSLDKAGVAWKEVPRE